MRNALTTKLGFVSSMIHAGTGNGIKALNRTHHSRVSTIVDRITMSLSSHYTNLPPPMGSSKINSQTWLQLGMLLY
ncbi:hypothetical protein DVH24_040155 [Malus domestica]|uniref:Uncharacterized protein n=1 Tax=Malus domestica TaxID=3750 RepID=A0A498IRV8_MALDO|nr:hypothetical protein DVH24_040155 [Malus domestica]